MILKTLVKRLEVLVLGLLGISMTLVMIGNVVLRYVFDSSIIWAEEYVRICFVWAMFIAVTASFVRREHIGFDAFMQRFGLVRIQEILYGFVLAAIGTIMAYYGWIYNGYTGSVTLPGTNFPTSVLLLPGILAGVIWTVIGLVKIGRALLADSKGKE